MTRTKAEELLIRGDATLAEELAKADLTFLRWLRRSEMSHVALVSKGAELQVVKVGSLAAIEDEFEAARGLSHKNILRPHGCLRGLDFAALRMPYFEGSTIVEATRENTPRHAATLRRNLPMAFGYELNDLGENSFVHCGREGETKVRRWLSGIVRGLSYIHGNGLLHLDVAPDNILVRGDDAVLIDFGLARRADHNGGEDALIGSAAYLAPELGVTRATTAADWYSLGVVLFQALTGGLPFEGGGPEVLVRKQSLTAPRVSDLCPEVAPDLDETCAAWLTREPRSRGDARALQDPW